MAGRLRTIDARTLADAVLEPPGYAVKDLLVQGLHMTMPTWRGSKSWPTAAGPLCCWSTICASSMTATR